VSFLIDTNIISEIRKGDIDAHCPRRRLRATRITAAPGARA